CELSQSIKALNIPNIKSMVSQQLSITIGVEHCQQIHEEISLEQFIAIADQALFHAKNLERGTVHMFNKRPEC
ncbi:GGDEF domain-containing protein, partial [Vibrio makurazakiensis]